jgi:hypothetical protein
MATSSLVLVVLGRISGYCWDGWIIKEGQVLHITIHVASFLPTDIQIHTHSLRSRSRQITAWSLSICHPSSFDTRGMFKVIIDVRLLRFGTFFYFSETPIRAF